MVKFSLLTFLRPMNLSMSIERKCARRKYFNSNLCWMRQYVSIKGLRQEFCGILTIILSSTQKVRVSLRVMTIHIKCFSIYEIRTYFGLVIKACGYVSRGTEPVSWLKCALYIAVLYVSFSLTGFELSTWTSGPGGAGAWAVFIAIVYLRFIWIVENTNKRRLA